jgi:hypothetical protein
MGAKANETELAEDPRVAKKLAKREVKDTKKDARYRPRQPAAAQNSAVARYDDLLFSSPVPETAQIHYQIPAGWFRRLLGEVHSGRPGAAGDGFEMARIKVAAYH